MRVVERSLVEDSVVQDDVVIGRGVSLMRVIVDEGCVIPDGFKAGVHHEEDGAHSYVTEGGVTLITPEMLGRQLRRVGCGGSGSFTSAALQFLLKNAIQQRSETG